MSYDFFIKNIGPTRYLRKRLIRWGREKRSKKIRAATRADAAGLLRGFFVLRGIFCAAVPAACVRIHSGGHAHLRQHNRLEHNPHDDEYDNNQCFHSVGLDAPGIESFQHFMQRF